MVAWSLGGVLASPWRRATVAMMAAMGTALIAALTVPVHQAAGSWGLIAIGGACIAAITLARRLLLAPRHPSSQSPPAA